MAMVGGARSLELAIHWRISRAWLRGEWRRKGEGEVQGATGFTGELEGEVEVGLVSEEEESGEPRGGEGGEKVEEEVLRWGRGEGKGNAEEERGREGGEKGWLGASSMLLL